MWLRTWLPTVLMVLVVALFIRLAVWQYQRAQEREAQTVAVAAAIRAPATRLAPAAIGALPLFAHVYVEGHYASGRQILLKEMPQPDGDQIGYVVLTPFVLNSGALVLIERGWIPMNEDRSLQTDLAAPSGPLRVTGYLGLLPSPGLRLGTNPERPGWPKRLLYPDWPELADLYGPGLVHQVIFLGTGEAGSYERSWQLRPEYGPQENYGYMAQWIALAVAVFVVWLVLRLRAVRRRGGTR
ncbi:MAG: SURF1 family protein [Gammaproteobacteria bacterium]